MKHFLKQSMEYFVYIFLEKFLKKTSKKILLVIISKRMPRRFFLTVLNLRQILYRILEKKTLAGIFRLISKESPGKHSEIISGRIAK